MNISTKMHHSSTSQIPSFSFFPVTNNFKISNDGVFSAFSNLKSLLGNCQGSKGWIGWKTYNLLIHILGFFKAKTTPIKVQNAPGKIKICFLMILYRAQLFLEAVSICHLFLVYFCGKTICSLSQMTNPTLRDVCRRPRDQFRWTQKRLSPV